MPNAFISALSRLFKRAGTNGNTTGRKLPGGIAPPGLGDVLGSPYVDTARKQRQPTRPELLMQFRNAVFVCANLNGDSVADVPVKLYVQTKTGDPRPKCAVKSLTKKQELWVRGSSSTSGRVAGDADVEEVTDHPLLDLLSKPNPWMSCAFLSKLTSLYMDLVGNCYWWIGDRGRLGIPKQIWPLPAHLVFPYRAAPGNQDNTEELVSYYLFTSYRTQYQIPPEDIVHFRMFNPFDPYTSGWAPLQAIIELVNVTEKMLGHTQAALDNQARPDAIVTPADVIGYAEAERLERRLQTKFRMAGYGGIMVAESPVDVKPFQWSPADLQALEVYGVTKDQVFDAYGVPQALATKDTNLANLQASLDQHARFGIKPRLVNRDETINRCLMPLYDDSGRLFVASDNPVPEDEDAKVKKAVAYVGAGIMKRSEARTADGLEEQDWADKPTLPSNQKPLDDNGELIQPDPIPGTGGPNGQRGNAQSNGSGLRSGGKPGGAQGGGSGRQGGKKDRQKKKKKGEKKGLGEAILRFNSEVLSGRLRRHQAVFSLAHGYGLTGDEADYLITRERPGDPRPTLKALAEQARTKAKDNLKWCEPDLKDSKDQKEIRRACKELAKLGADIDPDTLADCLDKGALEKLDDKTWNNIVNTESLDVDSLEEIRQRAHQRGKKVRNIFAEYIAGEVTAPIVVCFKEDPDKYFLVNGETRLSIANLFDVRPKMWYADLPDETKAKAKEIDELPCQKGKLSDCVSRKIPIFKEEHPDWTQEHCVAAAYGYCREKAKKRKDYNPQEPRDDSGRWTEGGGGGKKPPAESGGIKIKPTKERVFDGSPAEIKNPLSKQAAGKLGEEIIIAHLKSTGLKDARHMNLDRNNFPIDLIQDHEIIEAKTGSAGNSEKAQQWRLTIGEPGKEEKAWLAKASPEDKAAWNQTKQKKIVERKAAVMKELEKNLGHKVKSSTMTVILNPDTKTADLYKFDGWHDRIGWNSDQAKKAYIGSVKYA